MIVDTNVVMRLLDGPTHPLHAQAAQLVTDARGRDERVLLTDPIFLEVEFVLRSPRTGYGWPRDDIAATLIDLLDGALFTFEHPKALRLAVSFYSATRFDIQDCYVAARATTEGERVGSLDGDLRKL